MNRRTQEGGIPINPTIHSIKYRANHRGWIMTQTWEHLLFAHWEIPPAMIRSMVPDALEIDTYEGSGWITIIPFMMSGVRLRCLPPVPFTTTFPEINVRTYVKIGGRSGIYFLSLDASNPWITAIARKWYRLPYFEASMNFQKRNDGIEIDSRRVKSPDQSERFSASYQSCSDVFFAQHGSLEYWLTERYTLFCECAKTKRIYGANVYHEPWQLQNAAVQIRENTLTEKQFSLEAPPSLTLYSRGVQSNVWPIQEVKEEGGVAW
ncbi:DUF2071 domain-containing protein [Brevibacillus choshinensis]|uniref:YqjF family protein n=1 Tax=Brevibacillus choshinensis TaxID=54911 RepID=UPI002E1C8647|nr:DUF2071 domain-containing protein [Brevibacillus choshinensis]